MKQVKQLHLVFKMEQFSHQRSTFCSRRRTFSIEATGMELSWMNWSNGRGTYMACFSPTYQNKSDLLMFISTGMKYNFTYLRASAVCRLLSRQLQICLFLHLLVNARRIIVITSRNGSVGRSVGGN